MTTGGPLPAPAGSPEGSEKYILRVPAVDVNNNIEIRCSAYYGNQVRSTAAIYLRIQGEYQHSIVATILVIYYSPLSN